MIGRLRAVLVALVVIALWAAASVLARTAHHERVERAALAMAAGTAAVGAGRGTEAVALLRDAVALDPLRPEYRLELGKALFVVGRLEEAEPYVYEVLRRTPVDGESNLVLARILARQGNQAEAESAYYRAIYGRWSTAAQPLRRQARLELIALYRSQGATARLRAALLELSNAFPGDRELQLQAGRDLLAAGFADDAARQLRLIDERFADPGRAPVLLARAEFARRHYVEAYEAAGRALVRLPADPEAAAIHALSARVLSLDPDQPRLSPARRAARVRALLTDVHRRLGACGEVDGPEAARLLATLTRWLARRGSDVEVGRSLLQAAATRWATTCPDASETDAAGRVLTDLATDLP